MTGVDRGARRRASERERETSQTGVRTLHPIRSFDCSSDRGDRGARGGARVLVSRGGDARCCCAAWRCCEGSTTRDDGRTMGVRAPAAACFSTCVLSLSETRLHLLPSSAVRRLWSRDISGVWKAESGKRPCNVLYIGHCKCRLCLRCHATPRHSSGVPEARRAGIPGFAHGSAEKKTKFFSR